MANLVTNDSHPSYSIGPLKVQRCPFTAASGVSSGTIVAVNISQMLAIFTPGLKKTSAVTFSGNTATLAFTVPTETAATQTKGGVTYTAVADLGADGDSITVAYTGGGTAGAEVVTVTGSAISVQIQSGVSTITQVRTAVNALAAAAALVTATGTSGTAVSTAGATACSGGVSGGCRADAWCIGY
jgi:hypothetical protein